MSPLFAYLDPATGTLIISAIVGGFAAIAMVFKRFWYQIKSFFTGGKGAATVPADGKTDEA